MEIRVVIDYAPVIFVLRFNQNVLSKRKYFRFLSGDPSSASFKVASRRGRVFLNYASAVRSICGTCEALYFLSKNSNEIKEKIESSMFERLFSCIKKITLEEKYVLIALDVRQLKLWRHSPCKGM